MTARREGLLFLASELDAFHDCADGDVSAGNGHAGEARGYFYDYREARGILGVF